MMILKQLQNKLVDLGVSTELRERCRWDHIGGTRNCHPVDAFWADYGISDQSNVDNIAARFYQRGKLTSTKSSLLECDGFLVFVNCSDNPSGRAKRNACVVFLSGAISTAAHAAMISEFVILQQTEVAFWAHMDIGLLKSLHRHDKLEARLGCEETYLTLDQVCATLESMADQTTVVSQRTEVEPKSHATNWHLKSAATKAVYTRKSKEISPEMFGDEPMGVFAQELIKDGQIEFKFIHDRPRVIVVELSHLSTAQKPFTPRYSFSRGFYFEYTPMRFPVQRVLNVAQPGTDCQFINVNQTTRGIDTRIASPFFVIDAIECRIRDDPNNTLGLYHYEVGDIVKLHLRPRDAMAPDDRPDEMVKAQKDVLAKLPQPHTFLAGPQRASTKQDVVVFSRRPSSTASAHVHTVTQLRHMDIGRFAQRFTRLKSSVDADPEDPPVLKLCSNLPIFVFDAFHDHFVDAIEQPLFNVKPDQHVAALPPSMSYTRCFFFQAGSMFLMVPAVIYLPIRGHFGCYVCLHHEHLRVVKFESAEEMETFVKDHKHPITKSQKFELIEEAIVGFEFSKDKRGSVLVDDKVEVIPKFYEHIREDGIRSRIFGQMRDDIVFKKHAINVDDIFEEGMGFPFHKQMYYTCMAQHPPTGPDPVNVKHLFWHTQGSKDGDVRYEDGTDPLSIKWLNSNICTLHCLHEPSFETKVQTIPSLEDSEKLAALDFIDVFSWGGEKEVALKRLPVSLYADARERVSEVYTAKLENPDQEVELRLQAMALWIYEISGENKKEKKKEKKKEEKKNVTQLFAYPAGTRLDEEAIMLVEIVHENQLAGFALLMDMALQSRADPFAPRPANVSAHELVAFHAKRDFVLEEGCTMSSDLVKRGVQHVDVCTASRALQSVIAQLCSYLRTPCVYRYDSASGEITSDSLYRSIQVEGVRINEIDARLQPLTFPITDARAWAEPAKEAMRVSAPQSHALFMDEAYRFVGAVLRGDSCELKSHDGAAIHVVRSPTHAHTPGTSDGGPRLPPERVASLLDGRVVDHSRPTLRVAHGSGALRLLKSDFQLRPIEPDDKPVEMSQLRRLIVAALTTDPTSDRLVLLMLHRDPFGARAPQHVGVDADPFDGLRSAPIFIATLENPHLPPLPPSVGQHAIDGSRFAPNTPLDRRVVAYDETTGNLLGVSLIRYRVDTEGLPRDAIVDDWRSLLVAPDATGSLVDAYFNLVFDPERTLLSRDADPTTARSVAGPEVCVVDAHAVKSVMIQPVVTHAETRHDEAWEPDAIVVDSTGVDAVHNSHLDVYARRSKGEPRDFYLPEQSDMFVVAAPTPHFQLSSLPDPPAHSIVDPTFMMTDEDAAHFKLALTPNVDTTFVVRVLVSGDGLHRAAAQVRHDILLALTSQRLRPDDTVLLSVEEHGLCPREARIRSTEDTRRLFGDRASLAISTENVVSAPHYCDETSADELLVRERPTGPIIYLTDSRQLLIPAFDVKRCTHHLLTLRLGAVESEVSDRWKEVDRDGERVVAQDATIQTLQALRRSRRAAQSDERELYVIDGPSGTSQTFRLVQDDFVQQVELAVRSAVGGDALISWDRPVVRAHEGLSITLRNNRAPMRAGTDSAVFGPNDVGRTVEILKGAIRVEQQTRSARWFDAIPPDIPHGIVIDVQPEQHGLVRIDTSRGTVWIANPRRVKSARRSTLARAFGSLVRVVGPAIFSRDRATLD